MDCPVTGFDCITCEHDCNLQKKLEAQTFFHVKRDPSQCVDGKEHEFVGWRDFEDGRGGETVCKHCGIGAMEHSMAIDF